MKLFNSRLFWLVVLVVSLSLLFAVVVSAQDVTDEPAPTLVIITPGPTSEPPIVVDEPPAPVAPVFEAPAFNDALQAFLAALVAIFASAIASPITAPLVSLIKRIPIPLFQNMSGQVVNVLVALVLSAVFWVGQVFGFSAQVDTAYRLVYALLPFVAGAGANFLSNAAVYSVGKNNKMPVLGYQRSKAA